MRKDITQTKKQCMVTAIAGLTLLLVFGGTASGCSGCGDTKVVEDPKIEIQGGDLDFEFDPTKEITITPVPSGGEKEDLPTEIPDEEGNLPLNPGEDEDLTPAPTEEPTPEPIPTEEPTPEPIPTEIPTPTPVEEPTLPPTPTPIEEPADDLTPAPVDEPTLAPTPTPIEKDTTPTPTKEPEPTKFVEKKNPTLEEDGYTFEDPTDYKVGEVVETITTTSGVVVDCIHHEPGDVFAQALDGLERNATYVQRFGDDGVMIQVGEQKREIAGIEYTDKLLQYGYEMVCYGKLPEELIHKYFEDDLVFYIDENGDNNGTYFKGIYRPMNKVFTLDEIIQTKHNVVEAANVPLGGGQVGSFN